MTAWEAYRTSSVTKNVEMYVIVLCCENFLVFPSCLGASRGVLGTILLAHKVPVP
jgi:hypothetical protein